MRLVLGLALCASALAALTMIVLIVSNTGWDDAWLQFLLLPVALLLVFAAGVAIAASWRRALPAAVPVLIAGFVIVLGAQIAVIGAPWPGVACMAFGIAMLFWRGRVSDQASGARDR